MNEPSRPVAKAHVRWAELDRCKGMAIVLVVIGHLVADGTPTGFEVYHLAKMAIYDFHMPFFMYVSGFIFVLAGLHDAYDRYPRFLRRRAMRLLAPFLLFGAVIVVGKYFFQFIGPVEQAPRSLAEGFHRLIFDTAESPAISIWYVWVLFIYSAATPLMWRLLGPALFLLAPGLLVLAAAAAPDDDLYFDRIVRFAPFFMIGAAGAHWRVHWLALIDRGFAVWAGLFAASFALLALDIDWRIRLVTTGTLAAPALHALARAFLRRDVILRWIGERSFAIYLMNTICIGLAAALMFPASRYGVGPWIALPTLFAAGLAGPVLIREFVFARIPPLYRLTA